MKHLRYGLEAGLLWVLLRVFRLAGIERASAAGAVLGRAAGLVLRSRNRVARRNLQASFPGIGEPETRRILAGMWRNFGSFVGEFPHVHDLDVFAGGRVEIVPGTVPGGPAPGRGPAVYFSAHYGNFEIGPLLATQSGLDVVIVYRAASNPWSDAIIQSWRGKRGGTWVSKGREGGRALLEAVRSGTSVAILADQKFNRGVPVPFFGRDAMMAPAIAELALRHDVPLIPVRVVRGRRAHFRIEAGDPVRIERTGDRHADVRGILMTINRIFEDWIREHPEQWLWIHNRWPDGS